MVHQKDINYDNRVSLDNALHAIRLDEVTSMRFVAIWPSNHALSKKEIVGELITTESTLGRVQKAESVVPFSDHCHN